MDVQEFINKCVDSGYSWSEGEHEGKDGYFIGSQRLDTVAHFTSEAIEANEWAALENQVVQGKDVYHVSRIVGYFSRIENWNKSKIGELDDRHKGDYKVKR
ncbi:MAG: hypothetical protein ABH868_03985 [bacterium]